MSTFVLHIQRPFVQQEITVEWVSVQSPTGSFVVGPGHRPLLSLVSMGKSIVYHISGVDHEVEVPSAGGILHIDKVCAVLVLP